MLKLRIWSGGVGYKSQYWFLSVALLALGFRAPLMNRLAWMVGLSAEPASAPPEHALATNKRIADRMHQIARKIAPFFPG